MKVIASAGSDVKVDYMRSLGVDFPFNYKKESYESALAKHGPINVAWVSNFTYHEEIYVDLRDYRTMSAEKRWIRH